jgi:hypothetical protein
MIMITIDDDNESNDEDEDDNKLTLVYCLLHEQSVLLSIWNIKSLWGLSCWSKEQPLHIFELRAGGMAGLVGMALAVQNLKNMHVVLTESIQFFSVENAEFIYNFIEWRCNRLFCIDKNSIQFSEVLIKKVYVQFVECVSDKRVYNFAESHKVHNFPESMKL